MLEHIHYEYIYTQILEHTPYCMSGQAKAKRPNLTSLSRYLECQRPSEIMEKTDLNYMNNKHAIRAGSDVIGMLI